MQVLVLPILPEPVCVAAMGPIPLVSHLPHSTDAHNAAGCLNNAMEELSILIWRHDEAKDARGQARLQQMPHRSSIANFGSLPGNASKLRYALPY